MSSGGTARENNGAPVRRLAVDRFFEFSLLGLVGSGFLAVAGSGYLDKVAVALTSTGLLLRALMAAGWVRLRLSARVVLGLAIVYAGFYPLDYAYFSRDFLTATIHLVCFLAVVRILSAQTERDYFFVKLIAFLEMVGASVLPANLSFFVFLALFLIFGVATFASGEIRRSLEASSGPWRTPPEAFSPRLAGATAVTVLGILMITAGLFFVLPRTARAAFRHLVPDKYHLPGFSTEVRLGQIGEIQQQSTPVMRVRVEGVTRPLELKWRGTALTDFNGEKWFNGAPRTEILRVKEGLLQLADNRQRWRKGMRIAYEVHLRPIASDVLFFAGVPEFVRLNSRLVLRTSTNTFRLGYRTGESVRYYAYSFLEEGAYEEAPSLSRPEWETCLRLPAQDPRVMELAKRVTADARSDVQRAEALEHWLRREYSYTLELPEAAPNDPVAHFLFTRRKGHCEYFASSMAVMLRLLRIPARVATGFQSGTFNPISGWYLVRTSDAHSWVEAWLPERGWTTFDPTPPVLDIPAATLWSRMALYIDAAEVFWQDWVLSYDLDRQIQLAASMEESGSGAGQAWLTRMGELVRSMERALAGLSWKSAGLLLGSVLLAAGLGALLFAGWRAAEEKVRRKRIERGDVLQSDATVLYARMLAILARRGYAKPAWFTPLEFSRVLPPSEGAGLVREITTAYNELRFGGRRKAAGRMLAMVESLETAPLPKP
jgi:hypothetical protein